MTFTTYVCVDCRKTKRGRIVVGLQGKHKCPECRELMFKLYPRSKIPAQSDDKGWLEIRRELKRLEDTWFKNRASIAKWEAEEVVRKVNRNTSRASEATSDQELKYLEWRTRCVSTPKR